MTFQEQAKLWSSERLDIGKREGLTGGAQGIFRAVKLLCMALR
jgi:hypothetical protein